MNPGRRDNSPPPHAPGDTRFGYTPVSWEEKTNRVREVFDSVAERYDLMNDLMSFGLHRLWKRIAIEFCDPRPGETVLDLAAGTGDLTLELRKRTGHRGLVLLSDINLNMLQLGRDRLLDLGMTDVRPLLADAQAIPLASGSVDLVTMAFGLRNVARQELALAEIFRILKPGGRMVILEFSRFRIRPLRPLYDFYSLAVLPRLGQLVAKDAPSYRYLAESIRVHPDQSTLLGMLESAGFERAAYYNLSGGIVALHRGFKPASSGR